MKKILILANYDLPGALFARLTGCGNGCGERVEFVGYSRERVDLVCVLNTVARVHVVRAPGNKVIKIVQEPAVEGSIFHRFVTSHSRVYSKIFGHRGAFSQDPSSNRFIETAPLLFPQVSQIYPTTYKSQLMSIVSSKLTALPGHKRRNDFINQVHKFHPEVRVHTFGRGRNEVANKEEALDSYMYSLAIENSQIPSNITEKFIDCILRLCVPVYFGAENVEDYFPKDCVVQIPVLNEGAAQQILAGLSRSDYERRLPALVAARKMYLDNLQICCLLAREASQPLGSRDIGRVMVPPVGEVLKALIGTAIKWRDSIHYIGTRKA